MEAWEAQSKSTEKRRKLSSRRANSGIRVTVSTASKAKVECAVDLCKEKMCCLCESRFIRQLTRGPRSFDRAVMVLTRDAGDPGSNLNPALDKQWSRDYPIDVPATPTLPRKLSTGANGQKVGLLPGELS